MYAVLRTYLFPAWVLVVEKLNVRVTQVSFRDHSEVALYHTHPPSQHKGITIACVPRGTNITSKFLCNFLAVFWRLFIITWIGSGSWQTAR